MMAEATIITPPKICRVADIELAHELMREHRACRVVRCVWKAAAFHTLVDAGRLVPPSMTPRERAATRGITFPPLNSEPLTDNGPTHQTLREVLDKLSELAFRRLARTSARRRSWWTNIAPR